MFSSGKNKMKTQFKMITQFEVSSCTTNANICEMVCIRLNI